MFQLAPNVGHEGYWIWKFRENTIILCLDKICIVIPGGHFWHDRGVLSGIHGEILTFVSPKQFATACMYFISIENIL